MVIGIDPSCCSTGVAILDEDKQPIFLDVIAPKKLRGAERLQYIYNALNAIISVLKIDMAVVEGYAFGGKGQITSLAEVGGVIRLVLIQKNIPIKIVPPLLNKKNFAGSGRASKEDMMLRAQELYPTLDITNDNIADAIALAYGG